ncbi:hypothetical protein A2U01_0065304, partial [Trifolium medium]|nr:hypothetical protein [Trifolium medium]
PREEGSNCKLQTTCKGISIPKSSKVQAIQTKMPKPSDMHSRTQRYEKAAKDAS